METRGRERKSKREQERIWHPSDNVKKTDLALGQRCGSLLTERLLVVSEQGGERRGWSV